MKILIGMILALFFFVYLPIHGIHWNTGNGEQTGYVSAVEKTGLFWKTGRVYIKPTLESTQEDVYCVVDEEVFNKLKEVSVNKTSVTVKHKSFFSAGSMNCEGETAIIVEVI
jgi:hypothetical protein